MKGFTKIIGFTLIVLMAFGMSSCFLFRGKNKCGDCPTWSKQEVEQENSEEVNV